MRRASVALLLAWSMHGCGLGDRVGEATPRSELPRRWHYEVLPDQELANIEVKICFEGAVPSELRAGTDEAAVHLRYARWLSPGAIHKLPVRHGRIQLDRSARDACIAYGVRLDEVAQPHAVLRRVGRDVVASPNVWLWRPQRRHPEATATLTIKLPQGSHAFLPWPERQGRYELDARAFRFDSYAAFGTFTIERFTQSAVHVEFVVLDGELSLDPAGLARWLRRGVDIAAISGRSPARELRILLVPTDSPQAPVRFGMVARGGSGSLLLFVDRNASEDALMKDWVLPHELSHLWLPFVKEAWLSEGFATYMQEVLRARAGVLSADEALTNLARGMRDARARSSGRTLKRESEDMHRTYAYRTVYWGGAAFFLLADLALRTHSEGNTSLDDVLIALQASADTTKVWQADALLARMDELAGHPVFVPLARECMNAPFPDVEPALIELGAIEVDGKTVIEREGPRSALRDALFSLRE